MGQPFINPNFRERLRLWNSREREMDGVDRMIRRKSLKELLGLKGMGCCGATWVFRPSSSTIRVRDDEDPQQEEEVEWIDVGQIPLAENASDQDCVGQIPAMNLATALAAERHYRAAQDSDDDGSGLSPLRPTNNLPSNVTAGTAPGTPLRVSLMRLLAETDGVDGGRETTEEQDGKGGVGCDSTCCVCMGRKKGAALIPCGHTFCRVCSRELWLIRGSCPLCNRSILEILNIF
ncbi:unnamed protein product [Camellia sinensis]